MTETTKPSTTKPYTSTLRDRQVAQTRELILDALTALLGDRRADEVTTRDIAAAAGVSERTVYRHFPDRTALIRLVGAVLAEQHDEWTEQRRYLGLEILAKSRLQDITRTPADTQEVTIPAITA